MLELFLAESTTSQDGMFLVISQFVVGVAIFVVAGYLAMTREPNDEPAVEVFNKMPKEALDQRRAGAPKQVRTWLIGVSLLAIYHIGRQVYLLTNTPDVWLGRGMNIVMYLLFMLSPVVLCFILLPRPSEATDQRLTFCSKLMGAGSLLMVVWGLLFVVTGAGPWQGGLFYLFIALPLYLASVSISQIRVIRRYDVSIQSRMP